MRRKILIGTAALLGCAALFAREGLAIDAIQEVPAIPVISGLPSSLAERTDRAREFAKMVFKHPVKVMDEWLLGTYFVEHDKDRMARGEPCTHIYRFSDRSKPVVTFHCVHKDRDAAPRGKILLKRVGIAPAAYEMLEFQFEGSTEGHAVPPKH